MSSPNVLCLFSAALCNIGTLDNNLFSQQPQNQQNNNFGGGQNTFNNPYGGGGGFNQFNQPQQQPNRQRQPHASPCRQRFQYVTDGTQWKGIIRFANFDLTRDNIIDADFALPQRNNQNPNRRQTHNRQGKIELVNDPNTISNNLENGLPILFETIFTSQNPVPKLLALYKNGNRKCFDQNIDPNIPLNTFRLSYTLKALEQAEDRFSLNGPGIQPQTRPPQNPQKPNNTPQNNNQGQRPPQNNNQAQRPPQNPSLSNQGAENFETVDPIQNDNNVCGVPVVNSQSLVVGGEPVQNHGEVPWLVAFYKSSDGNLKFICGGSLLNARYVLTAAHCIQDKGRDAPHREQDALLFIGKHNLIQWNEQGYEKRGALAFKVHPDWKPQQQSYDGDIALIQLDKAVKYSKFIRPICLWNGAADLTKVVGQVGIIAGWGKNDKGVLNTDFPKKVNVPIVADGTCLRANEAFVHITSDRTFCAGGRNGEGPCQGDSGGGLMLKVGKKWFIRGIVSASLRDGISCDVNSYAIFTDIAKFKPWIMNEIRVNPRV